MQQVLRLHVPLHVLLDSGMAEEVACTTLLYCHFGKRGDFNF
jgi:hypothetical protein